MKKILIIADGILAKHFLERAIEVDSNNNDYTVVAYRKITIPESHSENFTFHTFDPTSTDKMSSVMHVEYDRVIIVASKKIDLLGSYKNVRKFNSEVPIYIVDRWGLEIEDSNLTSVNSKDVIASVILDYLPDTPVFAHNIGLGVGEIMEVRIPAGSAYAYRHLGSIEQKNWRIGCIYRNNKLILPKPTILIYPNDLLLLVGEPSILQDLYRGIKKELGQFPIPFGSNIYVFINMQSMSETRMVKLLKDASVLHEKLNSKKLYIRVINPTNTNLLEKIRQYEKDDVEINISYYDFDIEEDLHKDIKKLNIGLFVLDTEFFEAYPIILYKLKTPIFKIGIFDIERLKKGIVFGVNLEDSEKDSSVIFDFSTQLNLLIELYLFNPDNEENQDVLAEHFENIAKIYGKKIKIFQKNDKNPLLELKKQNDIVQFVPFYKDSIKSKITSIFSANMNNLHFVLNDKYQLFLPILEQ